jgi:hypothetical protein
VRRTRGGSWDRRFKGADERNASEAAWGCGCLVVLGILGLIFVKCSSHGGAGAPAPAASEEPQPSASAATSSPAAANRCGALESEPAAVKANHLPAWSGWSCELRESVQGQGRVCWQPTAYGADPSTGCPASSLCCSPPVGARP